MKTINKKLEYILYYCRYVVKVIYYIKLRKKRFPLRKNCAGKKVIDIEEGNLYIYQKILSGEPFMAGRFGSTEHQTIVKSLQIELGLRKRLQLKFSDILCFNSGFFPNDEGKILEFSRLMRDLSKHVDLLGVWSLGMEDYIVKTYLKSAKLCKFNTLFPTYSEKPRINWTAALKNKKVLVIHPFEETIKKQYAKREFLFDDKNILPEFELKTIKAVQTIAGEKDARFKTWFDALNYMYEKALETDFDVALVGCGAYGFPLSAKLKVAGKQVIHMGGATQILFGIKGKRWEQIPAVFKLYNEHWVFPAESETPLHAKAIEGGCYW
jgi:hypothetical protein